MNTSIHKLLYFIILVFVVPIFAFSQHCGNYIKLNGNFSENKYYVYHAEASRSALFVKGETSKMYLDIYNGRDYRISFVLDDVLGGPVEFKLIDRRDLVLLYYNVNDDYAQEFEFTVTKSRELVIEIHVPGHSVGLEPLSQEKGLFRKNTEMGCVGVLIEHMISPMKGF